MREIKYRQGLFDIGTFCGWHYWGFIDGKFVEPAFSERSGVDSALKHSYEYTGLHDKTNKDIYEGDIIKSPSLSENGTYEIGKVYWNERNASWYVVTDESEDELNAFACDSFNKEDNCEIIGNIYENPELLVS